MADVKISNLPASTTPLAGTEVLPIVQSGTTVKVSVADLTAGRSFDASGMSLTSTDAGATAAPLLDLYRNSASPAASDTLGEIEFNGEDSAGNKQTYGVIHGSILSPTSGAEQGQLHFETATSGALTEKMIIGTTNLVINEIGGIFNVRIEGDTDANLFYTDATNSRVGIGLITPAEKLDVLGNAKVSGRATINTLTIGLGGQTSVATNTALGVSALNSASLTGTNNVGVGYGALLNNTTGSANSAVGVGALQTNTTGGANCAAGVSALQNNTTGDNNSAAGAGALQNNTTGANNSAMGRSALQNNTTGNNNSATGFSALNSNTTGANNCAMGVNALISNSTADANSAFGFQALLYYNTANNTAVGFEAIKGSATVANNTGINLTAVGYQALTANTSGSANSAVGVGALQNNTTGGNNSAVGVGALQINTTGNKNSAVGHSALFFNTTGGDNSALGVNALLSNTTGSNNSAVGQAALESNTTGNSNSAVGRLALLYYNTSNNTAVGYEAIKGSATVANNTGANLTAVGYQALTANTSGSDNTGVGDQAGDVITTGARNTIIGANSDPSAAAGNDQTVVGEGLTGKGDDTAFIGGTNGAYNEKNVTTWETTSDQRIKKDIEDFAGGIDVLEQIRVRTFKYRTAEEITDLPASAAIDQSGTQLGVIAQELQAVLPECVTENSTGVLSVNTDPLIWYLVNAVKQLSAEIQTLKGA